jgi:hypothetical protein
VKSFTAGDKSKSDRDREQVQAIFDKLIDQMQGSKQ